MISASLCDGFVYIQGGEEGWSFQSLNWKKSDIYFQKWYLYFFIIKWPKVLPIREETCKSIVIYKSLQRYLRVIFFSHQAHLYIFRVERDDHCITRASTWWNCWSPHESSGLCCVLILFRERENAFKPPKIPLYYLYKSDKEIKMTNNTACQFL